jgi:hypothetical protein
VSFDLITQKKIYEALNGVISCPVYDNAPQGSGFPYVTIGEANLTDNDTDSTQNVYISYVIHVWSRSDGRKEIKTIMGEIYSALHLTKFSESGYSFTENYFLSSDSFVDSDGKTRHGVQTFKLTMEII